MPTVKTLGWRVAAIGTLLAASCAQNASPSSGADAATDRDAGRVDVTTDSGPEDIGSTVFDAPADRGDDVRDVAPSDRSNEDAGCSECVTDRGSTPEIVEFDVQGDAQSCTDCAADIGTSRDAPASETSPSDAACSMTCSLAHAQTRCSSASCVLVACDAGWGDCNGRTDDGCETDLLHGRDHCGACGRVCSSAMGCMNGTCTFCCDVPGFGDCDGNCSNGCEIDLRTSASHCGACGHVCPAGTPRCESGRCV